MLVSSTFQKEDEKYEEIDEKEKMPHYEQKKWEEEQMQSAMYRFGAKEGIKKEDYDFVFDEQIEFIQALQMPGTKELTMKVCLN